VLLTQTRETTTFRGAGSGVGGGGALGVANGVHYSEVKRIIWTLMASGGKFKEEDAASVH
jgi:hypothetical protein